MFSAILVLLALPLLDNSNVRGLQYKPMSRVFFWVFVANFLALMVLGAKHVETPYIELGQLCTFLYFAWFLFLVPVSNTFENVLPYLLSSRTEGLSTKPLSRGNSEEYRK